MLWPTETSNFQFVYRFSKSTLQNLRFGFQSIGTLRNSPAKTPTPNFLTRKVQTLGKFKTLINGPFFFQTSTVLENYHPKSDAFRFWMQWRERIVKNSHALLATPKRFHQKNIRPRNSFCDFYLSVFAEIF